ncbi:MAG: hypothetical protein KGY67_00350 [Candidatus Thermoplasmatota archaeon]|nr:hypothetical protein [Candidatus Thermoplasmatota archaeon]
MIVKELIELLEKLNPNAKVVTGNLTSCWNDKMREFNDFYNIFPNNFEKKQNVEGKDLKKVTKVVIWGEE